MLQSVKSSFFLYFSFFIFSVIVLLQGCFMPFSNAIPGIDIDIFVYSAKCILNGDLMYKEVFDHKGPVLYLMNVLGLFLFQGNTFGIWLLQIISLFFTIILFYKTVSLVSKNKLVSILAVVSSVLFLTPLSIGDGTTQEWSLPYISLAFYLFVKYFTSTAVFRFSELFLISFSFVFTLLLQPNLVVVWIVFASLVGFRLFAEKKYYLIFKYIFSVFLFSFISILPFLIYGWYYDILNDFFFSVFGFNTGSYIEKSFLSISKNLLKELSGLGFLPLLIPVSFVFLFFLKKKTKNKYLLAALVFSIVFTALFCSIGNNYKHYYIIYAPLLVLPYAFVYNYILEKINKKNILVLVLFVIFQNAFSVYAWAKKSTFNIIKIQERKVVRNIDVLLLQKSMQDIVAQNGISSTDKILVFGNRNNYYLSSGLYASSKYSYVTPIIDNNTIIEKEYFADLQKNPPVLFIYQQDNGCEPRINDLIKSFLHDNYSLLDVDFSYLGFYGEVEVWIKKEK